MKEHITRAARKMGLFSDQEGILKRYINEEGKWKPHIDNCKDFIIESASNKSKGHVAVLGSGWLLDLPIEFLSDTFQQVHLVDLRHPSAIQQRLKKHPNVRLHTCDLTGGALLQVYGALKRDKGEALVTLNNLKLKPLFFYHEFDFVISLNILNQLDILLADYIKKKIEVPDHGMHGFRKAIQSNHLASLPRGRSCLISDVTEISTSSLHGHVNEKELVVADLSIIEIKKEWVWDFDSLMTYQPLHKTQFKVIAANL